MAILEGDIKLVATQVMDDVPEGGGAPTATVIHDGASNEIFPDISELDRAGGRVSFRKVDVTVQTENVDTYLGSNVIVAKAPVDPNVSVTLFTTREVFDTRDNARNRVESYLAPGPLWGGALFGNHITGQGSLQFFQRPGSALPPVGRTLLLIFNEGLVSERAQYVRVTEVGSEIRTFTYGVDQDYLGMIVTVGISDRLRYDFPGTAANRSFITQDGKTQIRDTVVADAATYFGVSPTTQEIEIGDVKAKVESIFTQLVPSAQTEIPLVDTNAAGEVEAVVDSATGTVSINTSVPFSPAQSIYLGNSFYPGSLNVTVTGGVLTDDSGQLLSGSTVVGTVDYVRGVLAFISTSPTYSGSKTITFKPAGAPLQLSDSASISVTQSSRASNYNITVTPPPAPGTTRVAYRSNGAWYELRDTGGGALKGSDTAFGVGTVNFTTGTISVTLGALPDDGGEIIFNWGSVSNYINRSDATIPPIKVNFQLAHAGVAPGTFALTWNDGTARTVTDNGHGGLTGSATGTIRYQTGEVQLALTTLPAGGQEYAADYSYGPPSSQGFTAPARDSNGDVPLLLDEGDIMPGTVEMVWNTLIENYEVLSTTPAEMQIRPRTDPYKKVRDDGAGYFRDETGAIFGTINYATGAVLLTQPDLTVTIPYPRYTCTVVGTIGGGDRAVWLAANGPPGSDWGGSFVPTPPVQNVYRNVFSHFEYVPAAAIFPDESGLVTITYRAEGSDDTVTESFDAQPLKFDLTESFSEDIVAGSVNFSMGGNTYFDRLGELYYQLNPANGSAVAAGTINYTTGEVVLAAWTPGASAAVGLHSLLTSMDANPVDEATFRLPIAPIRPGSFQLLATKLTGGLINVTALETGQITGSGITGYINYETGVVRVKFGTLVLAAGNEDEIWYNEAAVRNDDKIFKPLPVFANTIKYNAVAFTYLPLDADLLGLDPVRLPQDGRVPIYRKGGFVVIGHTDTTDPETVGNGDVIDVGRVRLSRVRVLGENDLPITSGYTVDLEAGTVTATNVTGWDQPVRVEHRIEDMAVMSDVQINGELSFTRPLTHDYPVGSMASSALVSQDLKARTSIFFDQATFNGWADEVVGSVADATYNSIAHPVLVTNKGAVTERWAVRFTSTTAFQLIGEHVGIIATGTTGVDLAPINPATGTPYFTLSQAGWGTGWGTGNVLRFNTVGALFPLWLVRTVQQGAETVMEDSFTVLVRGDVNRP